MRLPLPIAPSRCGGEVLVSPLAALPAARLAQDAFSDISLEGAERRTKKRARLPLLLGTRQEFEASVSSSTSRSQAAGSSLSLGDVLRGDASLVVPLRCDGRPQPHRPRVTTARPERQPCAARWRGAAAAGRSCVRDGRAVDPSSAQPQAVCRA